MTTEITKTDIQEMAKSVNFKTFNDIISFGVDIQKRGNASSDKLIKDTTSKEIGEIGKNLSDLSFEMQQMDINKSKNIFDKIFRRTKNSVFKVTQQFKTVEANVDAIAEKVQNDQEQLRKDISSLENMLTDFKQEYLDLNDAIGILDIKMKELNLDKEKADQDVFGDYNIQDIQWKIDAIQKRKNELRSTQIILEQNATQIHMIQKGNMDLDHKFQYILGDGLATWKNQLAIAIATMRQKSALQFIEDYSKASNRMLLQGAKNLESNYKQIATLSESSLIDAQTLVETQQIYINTIKEAEIIHLQGIKTRMEESKNIQSIPDNKLLGGVNDL